MCDLVIHYSLSLVFCPRAVCIIIYTVGMFFRSMMAGIYNLSASQSVNENTM